MSKGRGRSGSTQPGGRADRSAAPPHSALAAWGRAAAVLILAAVIAAAFALVNTVHGIDLRVYYEAGRDVVAGTPLYGGEAPATGGSGGNARVPFTYPPFAALLAVPLHLVSWGLLQWLWSVLTIAALAVVVALAYGSLMCGRRAARSDRRRRVHVLMCVAGLTAVWAGSGPVTDHLGFGQVGMFLMAVCMLDADPRVRLPRWLPRGVLTGCAGAVKLVPAAYLVVPLLRRRWRIVVTGAAAFATCTLVAFAVLPGDTISYLTEAFPHLSERVAVGDPAVHGNQSIRGMLLRSLPDGTASATVDAVWLALCAAVIPAGIWAARRAQRSRGPLAGLVVLALAVEIAAPVSWTHHFVWLVPAVGLLLTPVPRRRMTVASRVVAAVVVVAAYARTAPLVASYSPGLPVLDRLGTEAILLAAALTIVALGLPAPAAHGHPRPDRQGTFDVRGRGTTRAGCSPGPNFLALPAAPACRAPGSGAEPGESAAAAGPTEGLSRP